jgi:hypothetical protein
MAHQSLKLLPGVDVNKTPALNEAAISQSQLVRFIPDRTLGGLIQKLGGWTKFFASTISSTVRCLWAWESTNAHSYLAIGAEGTVSGGALSVIASGGLDDITPQKTTVNTTVSAATTVGSNAVVITDTGRNISSYDSVDIQTQISVGGLVLFGQYQCYNPGGSANTYTIFALDPASSAALATFSTTTPITVTGSSGTGSVATLTFAGSYVFPVGSSITVTGMTPIGYDGSYVVTASSAGSVSYDNLTTGAFSVAGTISNTGLVPNYATTSGQANVSVTLSDHNYVVGDTFPALVATTVGGITIYGNYIVNDVLSSSVFVISGSTIASATTTGFENGGQARYVYYKGIGPLPAGTGYGIGPYGIGGYGTGVAPTLSGGTPITAVDWTLDNWGEILIACPLNGPIYAWSPTAGDPNAIVIPEAPSVNEGIFVAMPQRQIIAWGSTTNGIKDPLLVRWCEVENYNQWIPTIINQAGSYRVPKGSRIVQGIQAGQQGLIWTDLGIWAMQYAGPPYVYQFNELGNGCGLIGRKAATSINGVAYWMGQSQFFRLSGNGVEPIRCPIWDVVFQDLDTTNLDRIRVAANSRFGEITWYFPTYGNSGENEGYVKYNFILEQWDYGFNSAANPYVARTAWINESVLGPPIGAALNNYIYQHETSTDADGAAMVSYFQTGYFVLSDADVKMFIDQVWPDMKWGYYGGAQSANILLTFYVTDYPGQTPLVYGPYTLTQVTTYITPRFRGRLVSIRVESNEVGSFWRLGNFRYRIQADGRF